MRKFLLSPAAQADLENIWDYTEQRWDADQAEEYPSRGSARHRTSGHEPGNRQGLRGKMDLAMQLIFTPLILRLIERRNSELATR